MKTLFPAHFVFTFFLLVIQTYLLIYVTLLLFRRLKLMKRPYGGMDYSESLPAAVILLGVLLISSGDVSGVYQAAKSYGGGNTFIGEPFLLFFARSFMITLIFSLLFIVLNFLNIRFLFRGHFREPSLTVSIILCAIIVGFASVCWLTCKEVIDNITPRVINFL
jgi:hypothetical protein